MSGWTKSEAQDRARLWELMYSRSEAMHHVEYDLTWGEWVVISQHPGQDATVQRKPRRGLRQNWRVAS
jgi:hypothetical protein